MDHSNLSTYQAKNKDMNCNLSDAEAVLKATVKLTGGRGNPRLYLNPFINDGASLFLPEHATPNDPAPPPTSDTTGATIGDLAMTDDDVACFCVYDDATGDYHNCAQVLGNVRRYGVLVAMQKLCAEYSIASPADAIVTMISNTPDAVQALNDAFGF